MARKDNSGYVLPQIIDPPRKCVQIWIPDEVYHRGAFWGAIFELTQAFNWKQNDPTTARAVANLWFDIWSEATKENNDMTCCDDRAVIRRINPETGMVEQSVNNGSTWTPAAGGLPSVIVTPVPPVTSGVAATKCDAATNVQTQVQAWIDHALADFDTAVSLLEFSIAILEAILAAVLVVLSAGALTPLEALVLPTLGAALAAAWGAGKAAFEAYWVPARLSEVLCAAYCHISDDGSFTDAQFAEFWGELNGVMPPSPAKMLFMGFLSSVSTAGLNAMAASGTSADADCNDCLCEGSCTPDGWTLGYWINSTGEWTFKGTVIGVGADYVDVQSYDRGDGQQMLSFTVNDLITCCTLDVQPIGAVSDSILKWSTPCGTAGARENYVRNDLLGNPIHCTSFEYQMNPRAEGWQFRITFVP